MKLFTKGDLIVVRQRHNGTTHFFITAYEMKDVMNRVGEVAYCLYSYFRTGFFKESADINDDGVAETIGWPVAKVKKYRLVLESTNLLRKVKMGPGCIKVVVGAEMVALFDAGLPENITDSRAFTKLKKRFDITNTEELIAQAETISKEYALNPDLYR